MKKIVGILVMTLLITTIVFPVTSERLNKKTDLFENNEPFKGEHEQPRAYKPSARWQHSMVYDSDNNKIIMYGGGHSSGYLSDTWVYDYAANQWENKNPTTYPPSRLGHAMVYDYVNNVVILFGGGTDVTGYGDTWCYHYNGNYWVNRNPATAPSARIWHAMSYDGNYVVLFGGFFMGSDETWHYTYTTNTWEQQFTGITPTGRMFHAMAAYSDDKTLMVGGWTLGDYTDEVYTYYRNLGLWDRYLDAPFARAGHAMAYDSTHNIIVLFGGTGSAGLYDETWVYDINAWSWTRMYPANKPSPRTSHTMVYDSKHDKIILFGGNTSGGLSDELWAYDYDTNTWTELHPKSRLVYNSALELLLQRLIRYIPSLVSILKILLQ